MSGTKTLQRCRNNKEADNVVLIDVNTEHFDNVIIIDVPESLPKKWLGSSMDRKKEKWPFRTVICIDDDDESTDDGQNDDHHQNLSTERKNAQHKEPPVWSSNGKTSYGNEASSPFISQEDAHFDSTSYGYSKSDGHKKSHSGAKDPPFNYAEQKNSQHYEPVSLSSQNEGSLNPSVSSYSPYHVQGTEQVDHPTMAFQDDEETRMNSFHGKHSLAEEEAPMCKRQNSYETDSYDFGSSLTDKEKKLQETFTDNNEEHLEPCQLRATSNVNKENLIDNAAHLRQDNSSFEAVENLVESVSKSMHEDEDDKKNIQNGGTTGGIENCIIVEREKLKETDEYKRALEVEWASRQQALKTQAEESQRLRQLRKRKKAESTRLQDMAKRQKQRVDEVRETQKKDVENINLKEVMRSQVRKELKKLEMACSTMASLLHSLGIQVGSWPCPSPNEVQAAYKRALLKFHPDRAPKFDIRQQVEAEEKFKLINRLKEKLLPSL